LALVVLDWLLDGLEIEGKFAAIAGAAALSVANALILPAIVRLTLPVRVLTLGLGALVIDGLLVFGVLKFIPGITLDSFTDGILVVIGMALVTSLLAALLSIDDEEMFDRHVMRQFRDRSGRTFDTKGLLVVQIDGLAYPILKRAVRNGDAPTLARMLRDDSHRLIPWETEWSSQTGVSQCGLLLGSTDNLPAFRFYEKANGELLVSNNPTSAAEIERRHTGSGGLLANDGSSYGNLYSGGADRAVLTMSVVASTKEGGVGAGYGPYFSHPYRVTRTISSFVAEVARERREARAQRRNDVQPRIHRHFSYALLRAFTTIIMRDVCVHAVLADLAEGRTTIFVNLLGYDEVAHHSGPERSDSLRVLRQADRQLARLDRARHLAPREYDVVVVSDHGQSQGLPFAEAYGTSLDELVSDLVGVKAAVTGEQQAGYVEADANLDGALAEAAKGRGVAAAIARRIMKARSRKMSAAIAITRAQGSPVVLASGNLGLVYLPGEERRLTAEEINEQWPALVPGLCAHEGIGFVLVKSATYGHVVRCATGWRSLSNPDVGEGDDPLEPFGAHAAAVVLRASEFNNVADIMVNGSIDPETDEVHAFEPLVGSHGGLGGDQSRAFVMVPTTWRVPTEKLVGAPSVHRLLREGMDDGVPAATSVAK
jgi:uncharacterized membrane protein YvlD (DUF360 family)